MNLDIIINWLVILAFIIIIYTIRALEKSNNEIDKEFNKTVDFIKSLH
jgi:hypothetical protein